MIRSRHFVIAAAALAAVLGTPVRSAARQTSPRPPGQPPPVQTQAPDPAQAQAPAQAIEPCPAPVKQPPADSPALLRCLEFRFHPENVSVIDAETYRYYMLTKSGSDSSTDHWVPYDEPALLKDFNSLWKTNFLDNLWVQVVDEPYANGVKAEHVIFHMEERARVKVVDYQPANGGKLKVDVSKIEDALRAKALEIRADTFVDEATIRRVKGVIRDLYAEKGYEYSTVTTTMASLAGGPKLVHLTFTIDRGPEVEIGDVVFDGNTAFSDGDLRDKMKDNKPKSWLSFITDAGTYQAAKFEEDAQKILDFYREKGYMQARVGQQQIEILKDSEDGKKRTIRLRIPIDEGQRYRLGDLKITGNTKVATDAFRTFFKLKTGEFYDHKKFMKGYDKAREVYGGAGYLDFGLDPEYSFRGIDPQTGKPVGPEPPPAILDLTLHVDEGPQYLVNRITFVGNTTTHDDVIRRELRLVEGGIFNAEALKYSVRRLNQLGYFRPLEGKEGEINIEKLPDQPGKVNLTMKFQEQNRNQLAFGAGVSQFDGFFGQLSFQTANFLGRGETAGISLQKGSQARNYQLSFSEPFLFERPITAGVDVFARQYIYPLQYTQDSTGGHVVLGLPVADFLRFYAGYCVREGPRARHRPGLPGPGRARVEPVPARRPAHRPGRTPDGEQDLAEPGLQHGQRAHLPDERVTAHGLVRSRGGRRRHLLLVDDARGDQVPAPDQPHVARPPRADAVHPAVRADDDPADLRAVLHGRRVHGPRLRHPLHRAARRGVAPGRRRQQDAALQRGVLGQRRRARAAAVVLRRRPGGRPAAALRDGPVPDVDRHRSALLHAGAERPLPADFRLQSPEVRDPQQQPAAPEEVHVPVRGGDDLLRAGIDNGTARRGVRVGRSCSPKD